MIDRFRRWAPGKTPAEWYLIAAFAAMALFLALGARNAGVHPTVFVDEWAYSKFSRLLPMSEANIPLYVYFAAYRATNFCGDEFLACARALNSLFFIGALPLVYLVARRTTSPGMAALIACLTALSPINTFTVYYMPESMYVFAFWLVTWAVIGIAPTAASRRHWIMIGIMVAAMSMIKVHAWFLAIALIGHLSLLHYRSGRQGGWAPVLANIAMFCVAALGTRLALGYLLAGPAGIDLLGSFYGTHTEKTFLSQYPKALPVLALRNLSWHLAALATLFAVPMAALLLPPERLDTDAKSRAQLALHTYTVVVLCALLVAVSVFTASVVIFSAEESLSRLHTRLYSFATPLLMIVVAARTSGESRRPDAATVAAVLVVALAVVYALGTRFSFYMPSIVDSPELRSLTIKPAVMYSLGIAGLATLALWCRDKYTGARMFLLVFAPATVLVSSVVLSRDMRVRTAADQYDRGGQYARQFLPPEDLSRLAIVGSDMSGMYRALFYIDNPGVSLIHGAAGAKPGIVAIPPKREWVLLFGNLETAAPSEFAIAMDGFSLARLSGGQSIDFRKAGWPGVLAQTRGLSYAADWGRWSEGGNVQLRFSSPLPASFIARLKAFTYGPNVGAPFTVRVGAETQTFTFRRPWEWQEMSFPFTANGDRADAMTIEVPASVSPKALGLSDDVRPLGIAMATLAIEPVASGLSVDFSKPLRQDTLAATRGLSGAEGFGRWSDAKTVTLEFAAPLPRRFLVRIRCFSFGPNLGRPFHVRVGDEVRSFTLNQAWQRQDIRLAFTDNAGAARSVTIEVPAPTSPSAIGLNADTRTLGIALEHLRIESEDIDRR